jgi:hypothetical protein
VRGSRAGRNSMDRFPHRIQNLLRVKQDLVIPETKNLETSRLEKIRSRTIWIGKIRMLPAIDFDHQAGLEADEIHHESTDRMLSAEFDAQLLVAQMGPELRFGISLLLSEALDFIHTPSP